MPPSHPERELGKHCDVPHNRSDKNSPCVRAVAVDRKEHYRRTKTKGGLDAAHEVSCRLLSPYPSVSGYIKIMIDLGSDILPISKTLPPLTGIVGSGHAHFEQVRYLNVHRRNPYTPKTFTPLPKEAVIPSRCRGRSYGAVLCGDYGDRCTAVYPLAPSYVPGIYNISDAAPDGTEKHMIVCRDTPSNVNVRNMGKSNGRSGFSLFSTIRTDPQYWRQVKAELSAGFKGIPCRVEARGQRPNTGKRHQSLRVVSQPRSVSKKPADSTKGLRIFIRKKRMILLGGLDRVGLVHVTGGDCLTLSLNTTTHGEVPSNNTIPSTPEMSMPFLNSPDSLYKAHCPDKNAPSSHPYAPSYYTASEFSVPPTPAVGMIPKLYVMYEGEPTSFITLENCIHPLSTVYDLRLAISRELKMVCGAQMYYQNIKYNFLRYQPPILSWLSSLKFSYETHFRADDYYTLAFTSDTDGVKRAYQHQAMMLGGRLDKLQQQLELNIPVVSILETVKLPVRLFNRFGGAPSDDFFYPYIPIPIPEIPKTLKPRIQVIRQYLIEVQSAVFAEFDRMTTANNDLVSKKKPPPPPVCGVTMVRPSLKKAAMEIERKRRWNRAIQQYNDNVRSSASNIHKHNPSSDKSIPHYLPVVILHRIDDPVRKLEQTLMDIKIHGVIDYLTRQKHLGEVQRYAYERVQRGNPYYDADGVPLIKNPYGNVQFKQQEDTIPLCDSHLSPVPLSPGDKIGNNNNIVSSVDINHGIQNPFRDILEDSDARELIKDSTNSAVDCASITDMFFNSPAAAFRKISAVPSVPLHWRDNTGAGLLHYATLRHSALLIGILCDRGIDPCYPLLSSGDTALHLCVGHMKAIPEIRGVLVDAMLSNCNEYNLKRLLNTTNRNGHTPFSMACTNTKYFPIVALIYRHLKAFRKLSHFEHMSLMANFCVDEAIAELDLPAVQWWINEFELPLDYRAKGCTMFPSDPDNDSISVAPSRKNGGSPTAIISTNIFQQPLSVISVESNMNSLPLIIYTLMHRPIRPSSGAKSTVIKDEIVSTSKEDQMYENMLNRWNQILDWMLIRGVSCFLTDYQGRNAFHYAVLIPGAIPSILTMISALESWHDDPFTGPVRVTSDRCRNLMMTRDKLKGQTFLHTMLEVCSINVLNTTGAEICTHPVISSVISDLNIDIDAEDNSNGNSLLQWSIERHSEILTTLFAKRIQCVNTNFSVLNKFLGHRNNDGNSPLGSAIKSNFTFGIKILLHHPLTANIALSALNSDNRGPLLFAVDIRYSAEYFGSHTSTLDNMPHCKERLTNCCLHTLLEHITSDEQRKRFIDQCSGPLGETALHSAVRNRMWHCASLLLTHHASTNIPSILSGVTARQLGFMDKNDVSMLRLILGNDQSDVSSGETLMECVSYNGAATINMRFMKDYFFSRVQFNFCRTELGFRILHAAATAGNLVLLQYLLENGAREVDLVDSLKDKNEIQHESIRNIRTKLPLKYLLTDVLIIESNEGKSGADNKIVSPGIIAVLLRSIRIALKPARKIKSTSTCKAITTVDISSDRTPHHKSTHTMTTAYDSKPLHFMTEEWKNDVHHLVALMIQLEFKLAPCVLYDALVCGLPIVALGILHSRISTHANIAFIDDTTGNTPLHIACRRYINGGDPLWEDIVFDICNHTTNVNVRNNSGETPLSIVIQSSPLAAVVLILYRHFTREHTTSDDKLVKKESHSLSDKLNFAASPRHVYREARSSHERGAGNEKEDAKRKALSISWLRSRCHMNSLSMLAEAVCCDRKDIVELFAIAVRCIIGHTFTELLITPFSGERQTLLYRCNSLTSINCVLDISATSASPHLLMMILEYCCDHDVILSDSGGDCSRRVRVSRIDSTILGHQSVACSSPVSRYHGLTYGHLRASVIAAILNGNVDNAIILIRILTSVPITPDDNTSRVCCVYPTILHSIAATSHKSVKLLELFMYILEEGIDIPIDGYAVSGGGVVESMSSCISPLMHTLPITLTEPNDTDGIMEPIANGNLSSSRGIIRPALRRFNMKDSDAESIIILLLNSLSNVPSRMKLLKSEGTNDTLMDLKCSQKEGTYSSSTNVGYETPAMGISGNNIRCISVGNDLDDGNSGFDLNVGRNIESSHNNNAPPINGISLEQCRKSTRVTPCQGYDVGFKKVKPFPLSSHVCHVDICDRMLRVLLQCLKEDTYEDPVDDSGDNNIDTGSVCCSDSQVQILPVNVPESATTNGSIRPYHMQRHNTQSWFTSTHQSNGVGITDEELQKLLIGGGNCFVHAFTIEAIELVLKYKLKSSLSHILCYLKQFTRLLESFSQNLFSNGVRLLNSMMFLPIPNISIMRAIDYVRKETVKHGWWVESLLNVFSSTESYPFLSLIREISQSDPTTNMCPGVHDTLLHCAVKANNRSKIVSHILQSTCLEVKLNAKNSKGRTALAEAARFNKDNEVSQLLGAGADLLPEDNRGMTALHHAAAAGATCVVKLLLADHHGPHIADTCSTNPMASYPVMKALQYGKDDAGYELLTSLECRDTPRDITIAHTGETLLHFAAFTNCTMCMDVLINSCEEDYIKSYTVTLYSVRDYCSPTNISMNNKLEKARITRNIPLYCRSCVPRLGAAGLVTDRDYRFYRTAIAAAYSNQGVCESGVRALIGIQEVDGETHDLEVRSRFWIKSVTGDDSSSAITSSIGTSALPSFCYSQTLNSTRNAHKVPKGPRVRIPKGYDIISERAVNAAHDGNDLELLDLLKMGTYDAVRIRVYRIPKVPNNKRERAALCDDIRVAFAMYGGVRSNITFHNIRPSSVSLMNDGEHNQSGISREGRAGNSRLDEPVLSVAGGGARAVLIARHRRRVKSVDQMEPYALVQMMQEDRVADALQSEDIMVRRRPVFLVKDTRRGPLLSVHESQEDGSNTIHYPPRGPSLLHLICITGCVESLKFIIERYTSFGVISKRLMYLLELQHEGFTAYHLAVIHRRWECIAVFIGARIPQQPFTFTSCTQGRLEVQMPIETLKGLTPLKSFHTAEDIMRMSLVVPSSLWPNAHDNISCWNYELINCREITSIGDMTAHTRASAKYDCGAIFYGKVRGNMDDGSLKSASETLIDMSCKNPADLLISRFKRNILIATLENSFPEIVKNCKTRLYVSNAPQLKLFMDKVHDTDMFLGSDNAQHLYDTISDILRSDKAEGGLSITADLAAFDERDIALERERLKAIILFHLEGGVLYRQISSMIERLLEDYGTYGWVVLSKIRRIEFMVDEGATNIDATVTRVLPKETLQIQKQIIDNMKSSENGDYYDYDIKTIRNDAGEMVERLTKKLKYNYKDLYTGYGTISIKVPLFADERTLHCVPIYRSLEEFFACDSIRRAYEVVKIFKEVRAWSSRGIAVDTRLVVCDSFISLLHRIIVALAKHRYHGTNADNASYCADGIAVEIQTMVRKSQGLLTADVVGKRLDSVIQVLQVVKNSILSMDNVTGRTALDFGYDQESSQYHLNDGDKLTILVLYDIPDHRASINLAKSSYNLSSYPPGYQSFLNELQHTKDAFNSGIEMKLEERNNELVINREIMKSSFLKHLAGEWDGTLSRDSIRFYASSVMDDHVLSKFTSLDIPSDDSFTVNTTPTFSEISGITMTQVSFDFEINKKQVSNSLVLAVPIVTFDGVESLWNSTRNKSLLPPLDSTLPSAGCNPSYFLEMNELKSNAVEHSPKHSTHLLKKSFFGLFCGEKFDVRRVEVYEWDLGVSDDANSGIITSGDEAVQRALDNGLRPVEALLKRKKELHAKSKQMSMEGDNVIQERELSNEGKECSLVSPETQLSSKADSCLSTSNFSIKKYNLQPEVKRQRATLDSHYIPTKTIFHFLSEEAMISAGLMFTVLRLHYGSPAHCSGSTSSQEYPVGQIIVECPSTTPSPETSLRPSHRSASPVVTEGLFVLSSTSRRVATVTRLKTLVAMSRASPNVRVCSATDRRNSPCNKFLMYDSVERNRAVPGLLNTTSRYKSAPSNVSPLDSNGLSGTLYRYCEEEFPTAQYTASGISCIVLYVFEYTQDPSLMFNVVGVLSRTWRDAVLGLLHDYSFDKSLSVWAEEATNRAARKMKDAEAVVKKRREKGFLAVPIGSRDAVRGILCVDSMYQWRQVTRRHRRQTNKGKDERSPSYHDDDNFYLVANISLTRVIDQAYLAFLAYPQWIFWWCAAHRGVDGIMDILHYLPSTYSFRSPHQRKYQSQSSLINTVKLFFTIAGNFTVLHYRSFKVVQRLIYKFNLPADTGKHINTIFPVVRTYNDISTASYSTSDVMAALLLLINRLCSSDGVIDTEQQYTETLVYIMSPILKERIVGL